MTFDLPFLIYKSRAYLFVFNMFVCSLFLQCFRTTSLGNYFLRNSYGLYSSTLANATKPQACKAQVVAHGRTLLALLADRVEVCLAQFILHNVNVDLLESISECDSFPDLPDRSSVVLACGQLTQPEVDLLFLHVAELVNARQVLDELELIQGLFLGLRLKVLFVTAVLHEDVHL